MSNVPIPEQDQWRSFYQVIPIQVYERWKIQLRRLALVNGIAAEAWDADDKFRQAHGPRVMTIENLTTLLERSEDEALRT